jgi:hypothetical protein
MWQQKSKKNHLSFQLPPLLRIFKHPERRSKWMLIPFRLFLSITTTRLVQPGKLK